MHKHQNRNNIFSGAYVDRQGHKRADPGWVEDILTSDDARFVPIWGDQCLATEEPMRATMLRRQHVMGAMQRHDAVFLGFFHGHPVFAIEVDDNNVETIDGQGKFHDLRYLGSMLSEDDANLVAHARALVTWHGAHKFCGHCGAASQPESGGNSRLCSSKSCEHRSFPRVDPAIIVIVENGDQCLLGRQSSWPEGRYSTIAGFVEPGESLEDAVRREVCEETNIRLSSVRYHSSQPWPFPASLMLGFRATASSDEIRLNDGELEDARWFTRKELRSGFPKLPYRISIARRLVDEWLAADRL